MDNDLGDRLEQFLSRPDSMERIQAMMSSLSGSDMPPNLSDAPGKPSLSSSPPPLPSEGGMDVAALQKLLPLLQGMGGDEHDPNVTLLRALRPYLHDGREKRVDEAIRMMQLAKLLPLLKTGL